MPLAPVICRLRLCARPDAPIDVRRYVIDEGLSRPFRIEVDIAWELGADGGDKPQQLPQPQAWLGRGCTLELTRAGSAARRFVGVVEACTQPQGELAHRPTLTLTLVPHLALLAHEVMSETYADCTALDVLQTLLARALPGQMELRAAMDADQLRALQPREAWVRLEESTLDFMHRLLQAEGLNYLLTQPDDGPQVLWVCRELRHLAIALAPASLDLPHLPGGHATTESWQSFAVTQRVRSRPPKVAVFDPSQRSTYAHRHALPQRGGWPWPSGGGADYLVYGLEGTLVGDTFAGNGGESRAQAMEQQQASASWAGTGGSSNAVAMQPGQRVSRWSHDAAGQLVPIDSHWAIDVLHEGSDSDRGTAPMALAEVVSTHAYGNRVGCVPEHVAYQASYSLPEPRHHGLQGATVVGAGQAQDPYVDALGRVLVQFNGWRCEDGSNVVAPIWVRVSQAWAGAGMGTMFWPRPGMEVWVGFMGGSVDAPVVLGCAYNGGQKPPYAPDVAATRSGVKSKSLGLAGGSNELMFEDAVGEEAVTLKSAGEMTVSATQEMSIKAGSNQKISVNDGPWSEAMRQGLNTLAGLTTNPAVPPEIKADVDRYVDASVKLLSELETTGKTIDRGEARPWVDFEAVLSLTPPISAYTKSTLGQASPPDERKRVTRALQQMRHFAKQIKKVIKKPKARELTVYGDSLVKVIGNAETDVSGTLTTQAGRTLDVTAGTRAMLRVGKKSSLDAAKQAGISVCKVTGNFIYAASAGVLALVAKTTMKHTAPTLTLSAEQTCTIRSGKAILTLRDGVVTLQGSDIRLDGDTVSIRASKSLKLVSPATRVH